VPPHLGKMILTSKRPRLTGKNSNGGLSITASQVDDATINQANSRAITQINLMGVPLTDPVFDDYHVNRWAHQIPSGSLLFARSPGDQDVEANHEFEHNNPAFNLAAPVHVNFILLYNWYKLIAKIDQLQYAIIDWNRAMRRCLDGWNMIGVSKMPTTEKPVERKLEFMSRVMVTYMRCEELMLNYHGDNIEEGDVLTLVLKFVPDPLKSGLYADDARFWFTPTEGVRPKKVYAQSGIEPTRNARRLSAPTRSKP
jgi:hypothetical protein